MEATIDAIQLARYEEYKDSGVEWLGEIPAHWEVRKLKHICRVYNGDSIKDDKKSDYESTDELDLPYIATKDISLDFSRINYDNGLRIPLKNNKLKVAPEGSFLLCIEGGSAGKKIGSLNQPVCFVNKLACFDTIDKRATKYFYYFARSSSFQSQFRLSMTGLIGGVAISLIRDFDAFLPSSEEQTRIANFLDHKTAQIDQAIAQKERLIELLQERRQVMIHRAVTKGINPDVLMKDSGVEWIGEIPAHWEVKKLKYVLQERNEKSETGEETLLMMSQEHGLVVRSEYHDKAEVGASNIGNKKVYHNDLVFNKLKAHLGVFFKSTHETIGLVSPDYAVYTSKGTLVNLKYLELLFRHPAYIRQFIIRATGIVEGLIRLYTGDLFDIKIPIPPKEDQLLILNDASIIQEKVNLAIVQAKSQINFLKELKVTFINSAVTGKIKV